MRLSVYIGCVSKGVYEVGKGTDFFTKGIGFSYHRYIGTIHEKAVKAIFGRTLKPGEIKKLVKQGRLEE